MYTKTVARLSATAAMLMCGTTACFQTFQSPQVEPGFRVDADAMVLTGHQIDAHTHGADEMVTINPAYGFGRRVELGIPLGAYFNGGGNTFPVVMPYAKLALGDLTSKNHVAVAVQFPLNVDLMVGHDMGTWEPHAMLSYIQSAGGNHGDYTFYSRFAQDSQFLMAASLGATFKTPERPAIEIGVLRNAYSLFGPHVTYDAFVRMKVGFLK